MRTKTKKKFIILILIIAVCSLFYYFSTRQESETIDLERDIGNLDTGPHPAQVQLRFEREYNGLKFQDALNLTQEEYDSLTKEEILKMQDERFNNWVKIITAPSVEQPAEEIPQ